MKSPSVSPHHLSPPSMRASMQHLQIKRDDDLLVEDSKSSLNRSYSKIQPPQNFVIGEFKKSATMRIGSNSTRNTITSFRETASLGRLPRMFSVSGAQGGAEEARKTASSTTNFL